MMMNIVESSASITSISKDKKSASCEHYVESGGNIENEYGTESAATSTHDEIDGNVSERISFLRGPTTEKVYESVHNWRNNPLLICSAVEEYRPNKQIENIPKGCQWSPDGTCLLVPAADYRIRLYELPRKLHDGRILDCLPLPSLTPVVKVKESGLVYDTCWYPSMNSWNPATCYFLSTSKETPIHLWNAFTGGLMATYRAYNQVDEVEAAISIHFTNTGSTIWSGFKGILRSFDTDRPGRQVNEIALKKDFPTVHGIVSCIRENPTMSGLLAFGTYSKCIGLYKDGPLCSFKTDSGVTQIEFSPCGMKIYSAVRRSDEFLCWDLRNPGHILNSFNGRRADTNQRIQFSISNNGSEIISGNTDGSVKIWNTSKTISSGDQGPEWTVHLSNDCINGVNMHKTLPILATTAGQRTCGEIDNYKDNSVRLWYCNKEE